jgi:hypothetical protein
MTALTITDADIGSSACSTAYIAPYSSPSIPVPRLPEGTTTLF